ncbi:MAG: hypothetical protein J6Q47_03650, partial [Paludibacteraceae bacterium]|nr:hypothetical protein [Paludibacteraceae bacterium]
PVRQFSKLVVSATHPHFLTAFSQKRCKSKQVFSKTQTKRKKLILFLQFETKKSYEKKTGKT